MVAFFSILFRRHFLALSNEIFLEKAATKFEKAMGSYPMAIW
jgi:hypothetical protein